MNIVLEGPDGAGKSTLAAFLAERLRYRIHASEGPIRDTQDLIARYTTFLLKRRTIFDRLALISEPIYGPMMKRRSPTERDLNVIREFYEQRPLIVYCRPRDAATGMTNHRPTSAMDNSAYMAKVNILYPRLLNKYDQWARVVQPMRYEIGDDREDLARRIMERTHAVTV